MTWPFATDNVLTSDVFASIALILVLLAVRVVVGRTLHRRTDMTPQAARHWTANARNLLIVIGIIGVIMIWAPQLRTFALSLTAVAVAIVVATKELILCLSGTALRALTRPYSVGDWIEIGDARGEVLDYNLLVTTLQEFEGRAGSAVPTGRTIHLPHSQLFSSPLKIERRGKGNALHRFALTFEPATNIFAKRGAIEDAAKATLAALDPPLAPETLQIGFGTSDIGKQRLEFTLRIPPEQGEAAENALSCAIGQMLAESPAEN